MCIYETPGLAAEEGFAMDYPDIQVRVRGKPDDYQATRAKLQAIFDLLHAGEAAVGADYVYLYCKQSGPLPLGQDEKRRPHLAQNYRIMKNRP